MESAILAAIAVIISTVVVYIADILTCSQRHPVVGGRSLRSQKSRVIKNTQPPSLTPSNSFYYHGTSAKLDQLDPRPSKVIDGESAVFATSDKSTALMFLGKWTDIDIMYGSTGGVKYAMEMYTDAFDKLRAAGWIYTVDASQFHSDPRLGLSNEFICDTSVKIIDREHITDAFEEMKRLDEINFIEFSTLQDMIVAKYST